MIINLSLSNIWYIKLAKESDILECEVKWPYEALLWTNLVEVMEFQLNYFKLSKLMLLKCCTQYGNKFRKVSHGHRIGKCQFSFHSQRNAVPKMAQTTIQFMLFSYARKAMLKILQINLQQYMNQELPDVQAGFRKSSRGTRDQLPIKAGEFQKHLLQLH